jgi:hypothetical protein
MLYIPAAPQVTFKNRPTWDRDFRAIIRRQPLVEWVLRIIGQFLLDVMFRIAGLVALTSPPRDLSFSRSITRPGAIGEIAMQSCNISLCVIMSFSSLALMHETRWGPSASTDRLKVTMISRVFSSLILSIQSNCTTQRPLVISSSFQA